MVVLGIEKTSALLTALIVVIGLCFCGHGLYIYAKAEAAQWLMARAWSQTLENGGTPTKAWAWADTWPVAYMEVPKQNIRLYILSNSSGEALAFGPGHLTTTPALGSFGTSIIAGHRDTHFKFLQHTTIGDIIHLTLKSKLKLTYQITDFRIVDADRSGIDPQIGEGDLALVTCFPFDGVTRTQKRFVARASQLFSS